MRFQLERNNSLCNGTDICDGSEKHSKQHYSGKETKEDCDDCVEQRWPGGTRQEACFVVQTMMCVTFCIQDLVFFCVWVAHYKFSNLPSTFSMYSESYLWSRENSLPECFVWLSLMKEVRFQIAESLWFWVLDIHWGMRWWWHLFAFLTKLIPHCGMDCTGLTCVSVKYSVVWVIYCWTALQRLHTCERFSVSVYVSVSLCPSLFSLSFSHTISVVQLSMSVCVSPSVAVFLSNGSSIGHVLHCTVLRVLDPS